MNEDTVSGEGADLSERGLDEFDRLAREDQAVASRVTARPWKWWTANSRRELRAELGRRNPVVAHGQQHPHDRVIDIAIQEPDMKLIERAVNGLEERSAAVLALSAEVRRLREREVRGALAEIGARSERFLPAGAPGASWLLSAIGRVEACARTARGVRIARDPVERRKLLVACAAWALAAVRQMDRAQAETSGEPPRAEEEREDG